METKEPVVVVREMVLPTMHGGPFVAQVKYMDEAPDDVVVLRRGDQKIALKRDDLVGFILSIGDPRDIKKLIPVQRTHVRKLERMLGFEWTASRDYKKGDKIEVRAPWLDVQTDVEEVFADALVKAKKGKIILKT